VRVAYDQWTQFESFPKFMEGVEQVKQIDDKTLEWSAEIAGMQAFVSRKTGLFVGLETAAAMAALPALLESGAIESQESVVVFDTGSGFKSVFPAIEPPRPLPNQEEAWREAVEAIRREPSPG